MNVGEFFNNHVLPELQGGQVEQLPVLKADAIKFISTFRSQLPTETLLSVLPLLVRFLSSSEFVVHTYAAASIERLLCLKDPSNTNVSRISAELLRPHLQTLLTSLFGVLQMDDSKENEYAMKAIMRVCSVAQGDMLPYVDTLLGMLTSILAEVSKNPRQPMFNHYLFETLAVVVRSVCSVDVSLIGGPD